MHGAGAADRDRGHTRRGSVSPGAHPV